MNCILFLSFCLMTLAFDPTILVESDFNALRKFLMVENSKNRRLKAGSPTKRVT